MLLHKGERQAGELYKEIAECFPCNAYVYAVLESAVVLGEYQKGSIQAGYPVQMKVEPLSLEKVLELRVFNEEKEWKAVRKKNAFVMCICCDDSKNEHYKDEVQKLWGSVKRDVGIPGWCLLESDRGTRILFPGEAKLHTEIGLKIRKYYTIGQDEKSGLFQFEEERMYGFTEWNAKTAEPGREERNG